jgi:hypothetical protein
MPGPREIAARTGDSPWRRTKTFLDFLEGAADRRIRRRDLQARLPARGGALMSGDRVNHILRDTISVVDQMLEEYGPSARHSPVLAGGGALERRIAQTSGSRAPLLQCV